MIERVWDKAVRSDYAGAFPVGRRMNWRGVFNRIQSALRLHSVAHLLVSLFKWNGANPGHNSFLIKLDIEKLSARLF